MAPTMPISTDGTMQAASIRRNLQWREQLSDRSADTVYEVLASTPTTSIIVGQLNFDQHALTAWAYFDILGPDILTFMLSAANITEIFPHNAPVWAGGKDLWAGPWLAKVS